MAIIKTIEWDDGSGDKIYLDSNASEGNQTVAVSSDANTGAARTKIITFSTGDIDETLTVNQDAGRRQYTITLYPSSYDTEHYSWYSTSNISRGYTSASSTTYSQINGNAYGGEGYIYYKFDTSQIPNGATIDSVSCSVKLGINGNSTTTPIKRVQMYTGTTAKGTATTAKTATTTYDLDCGDWTLEEIRDIRVRPYMKEGANTSAHYTISFYGATLTITYTA